MKDTSPGSRQENLLLLIYGLYAAEIRPDRVCHQNSCTSADASRDPDGPPVDVCTGHRIGTCLVLPGRIGNVIR